MKWLILSILLALAGCKDKESGVFYEFTNIEISELSEADRRAFSSIKVQIKREVVVDNQENALIVELESIAHKHKAYPFTGYDQKTIYIRLIGAFEDIHATLVEWEELFQ